MMIFWSFEVNLFVFHCLGPINKGHNKTPVLKSLLHKAAGRKPCNFVKKRLQHRYFSVNIAKFLKTPILKNICVQLLLN